MKEFQPEVFSNPVEWNCLGTMRSLVFTSGIMGFCSEKEFVYPCVGYAIIEKSKEENAD